MIQYFNNLRTFLVLLVVLGHTSLIYVPMDMLAIYNCKSIPGMGSLNLVLRSFMMSLFFFTSGYFIPGSYDKYGPKKFIVKKFIRLGIPVLLLMPLGFGHLWFLSNLIVLCMLYIAWRLYFPLRLNKYVTEKPSIKNILFVGLFIGILCSVLRYLFVPGYWITPFVYFTFEPIHMPQYILMFVLGVLSYRKNWIEKINRKNAYKALLISAMLIIGVVIYNGGSKNDTIYHPIYGIYESLICVFLDYGLLYIFYKRLNYTNFILSWLSKHSFPIHIVHVAVLDYVMVSLYSVDNPYLQFPLALFITIFMSCFISYFLKLIPGLKKIL